jgi:prolycopene isomerase
MQNKIAHYKTPIENMILGGHWAELGGGVPIAVKAGANACLMVLKKEKKDAYQLLADYMDEKIDINAVRKSGAFKKYDNSWKRALTPAEKLALRAAAE